MAKHSLGIDTSFTTMSDQPTHNLGFFVQAKEPGNSFYSSNWAALGLPPQNEEDNFTVHCTLYSVYGTLYTVHRTLYTVHFSKPFVSENFTPNIFTKFLHPMFSPYLTTYSFNVICPPNFFNNFCWLNIFTQFSNKFFHPILLKNGNMCILCAYGFFTEMLSFFRPQTLKVKYLWF